MVSERLILVRVTGARIEYEAAGADCGANVAQTKIVPAVMQDRGIGERDPIL